MLRRAVRLDTGRMRPLDRPTVDTPGDAWFAGRRLRGAIECVDLADDPGALRRPGHWVVVGEFEGRVRAWRFAELSSHPGDERPSGESRATAWSGPRADAWTSSLDEAGYVAAVEHVRETVREGGVYQANICRVLAAPLPGAGAGAQGGAVEPDALALGEVLAAGNPAPYAGGVHVPAGGPVAPVWVVSASPELYLRLDGPTLSSGPIKGTAPTAAGLTAKDRAENVMITDLVRNDLQQVCLPGTVAVENLLGVEEHPGLAHLVSTVRGVLDPSVRDAADLWSRLLHATYPPGSVSGAPKLAALDLIDELEPVPRGPYCGAFGWVDVAADGTVRAELAVAIRTFWWTDGVLRFGTGAGITWESEASAEWQETELKARRLVALASTAPGGTGRTADAPPAAGAEAARGPAARLVR